MKEGNSRPSRKVEAIRIVARLSLRDFELGRLEGPTALIEYL
jgi:hypothetical protein